MSTLPVVIVFARAPRPGATKTRLIPALGADGAAELYRCFLLDTLANVAELEAEIVVAAAQADDADPVSELSSAACPRARVNVQQGRDLGERMAQAIERALDAGHPGAVLVGTDAPNLPLDIVRRALQMGTDHDVVIGPCFDGGYYLIGMREAKRELFTGIRWSSDAVLSDTLKRAEEQGLSVALLDPWYDVDTPEDLSLLRSDLAKLAAASRPVPCPRTWSYLRSLPPERPK